MSLSQSSLHELAKIPGRPCGNQASQSDEVEVDVDQPYQHNSATEMHTCTSSLTCASNERMLEELLGARTVVRVDR
eukprot:scaffold564_cov248-Pinguiococcus_pyrenoidosus.AAC.19